MTVETATYIGQLSPTYPTGSDAKSEGDSHLRLLKSVLQAQFTSLGNAPVTATAAQINALASASGLLSVGTSTTSNSIGTGSKTFTTQTGLGFAAGQAIRIQDNASLSNYMLGTISSYTTATGALVVTVDSIAGSGTIADWSISLNVLKPQMSRRAITTTDTVTSSDWCGFVDITSGTFTLSLSAAATLGAGFWCIIRNSGSGDVTVDPDGSETIDGLTSFVMYPGESRLLQCNGTAFYSIVLSGFNKTFTASGTFTKPPGYQRFAGQLWAGGGGGRKDTNNTVARFGGGGGSCATFDLPSSSFGTTEAVTIGAGGAGQTSTASGGNGGTSSIGSVVSAYGGQGGTSTTSVGGSAYVSGLVTVGSNGYHNGTTAAGATTNQTVLGGGVCSTGASGHTVYGGAGGGGIAGDDTTLYNPSSYSTSVFGGAGGAAAVATSGADGTAPGGGGGATKSGTTSGAGARGELRIWGLV